MGRFLLQPLVQQLQDAAESRAPVLPATRLLTILVPLVYRPALKVGLDAGLHGLYCCPISDCTGLASDEFSFAVTPWPPAPCPVTAAIDYTTASCRVGKQAAIRICAWPAGWQGC